MARASLRVIELNPVLRVRILTFCCAIEHHFRALFAPPMHSGVNGLSARKYYRFELFHRCHNLRIPMASNSLQTVLTNSTARAKMLR